MSRFEINVYDVIIAGGSFTGLALASALSQSSDKTLKVCVLDPRSYDDLIVHRFSGQAVALNAASKDLLTVLEIWQTLENNVQPITDIDITDSPMDVTVRPIFLQIKSELAPGKSASYMIENHHLATALAAKASVDPNIDLIAKQKVKGFGKENHYVRVLLESGGQLKTRLLVAADGRNSSLRKVSGIKTVSWSYGQMGIVTTVAHERPHNGRAVQHFLPAGPFAILPLKGNRSSLVWTENTKVAKKLLDEDEALFIEELERRFGPRLGELELIGPRFGVPLTMHIAREFIGPRFVLVGDSAHGVHPIAGLGLNIGLRDVAALTEVLIDNSRLGIDIGDFTGLERYQRWRRFDSAFSAFFMDGLNRLFSNDILPVRAAREIGLGLVNRSPAIKQFLVKGASGLSGDVPRLLKGEKL